MALLLMHVNAQAFVWTCMASRVWHKFADDPVLFSKTHTGLQRQFSIVESVLDMCGLAINARKCSGIRLDVHGKRKIWACNPHDFVRSRNGDLIKALSIVDGYRYLGNLVCRDSVRHHSV